LKEWIEKQWSENFYITAVAGADDNRFLVVMSKGQSMNGCFTGFLDKHTGTWNIQQSCCVFEILPFKWIKKKWAEGLYVTAIATSGSQWAVVSTKGTRFTDQVLLSSPFLLLPNYSSFQEFPWKCLEPEDCSDSVSCAKLLRP